MLRLSQWRRAINALYRLPIRYPDETLNANDGGGPRRLSAGRPVSRCGDGLAGCQTEGNAARALGVDAGAGETAAVPVWSMALPAAISAGCGRDGSTWPCRRMTQMATSSANAMLKSALYPTIFIDDHPSERKRVRSRANDCPPFLYHELVTVRDSEMLRCPIY